MCLWSFRDAALLQLPLKSFTALDAASTFGLLGLLVRPAASKTDWDDHSPPQATPDQQSPLFMRACYCWAAFRNKRKLKSPAVRRHPEVRERARGCEGGAERKARNSSHSPLVFSRFLKRQLCSRASEVRKQRGNGREQPEEEERILEGTRHLHKNRIESRSTSCSACLSM